jgi:hypothetical protein
MTFDNGTRMNRSKGASETTKHYERVYRHHTRLIHTCTYLAMPIGASLLDIGFSCYRFLAITAVPVLHLGNLTRGTRFRTSSCRCLVGSTHTRLNGRFMALTAKPRQEWQCCNFKAKDFLRAVDDSDDSTLLSQVGDSPILAGTPRSLRTLLKENESQQLATEIRVFR